MLEVLLEESYDPWEASEKVLRTPEDCKALTFLLSVRV